MTWVVPRKYGSDGAANTQLSWKGIRLRASHILLQYRRHIFKNVKTYGGALWVKLCGRLLREIPLQGVRSLR